MSIIKIEEAYLYTTLDHTHTACYEMKNWLDNNGIKYVHLHYPAENKTEVLRPLNTWWENANLQEFPILIYTEVREDTPFSLSPRRYFTSLQDLQASSFLEYAPRR